VIAIRRGLLDDMLAEGRRTLPLETGGVLMGYATDACITVTAVIGPGPRAVHRRHSFEPDAEWQQAKVAELYERSGRTDSYLGDWHTHPNGTTRLSFRDWLAALRIASYRDARCPNPLMVVLALRDEEVSVGSYRWQRRILRPMETVVLQRLRNPAPSRSKS